VEVTVAEAKKPAARESAEVEEREGRRGWLGWFVGWVLLPGSVIAAIVGAGVHVGARWPEMWFSRLVLWLFGGG
jgi:hypothetical protein